MRRPVRTTKPFPEALADLLKARGISQRRLAEMADVGQSHISRLLRQADSRIRPSPDLMRRIALAFDLPDDYFRERREALIVERLQSDDAFLESAYELLRKAGPRKRAPRR